MYSNLAGILLNSVPVLPSSVSLPELARVLRIPAGLWPVLQELGGDWKVLEEKKESLGDRYRWNGVPVIPNSAWNTPKEYPEVIDLTSPLPPPSLLPPTPPSSPLYCPFSPFTHPSPLLGFDDIVSNFDSITSSYSSLGNVGDIEF